MIQGCPFALNEGKEGYGRAQGCWTVVATNIHDTGQSDHEPIAVMKQRSH